MTPPDYATIARDRLRAAGVPEEEIGPLLERASALIAGLERLAQLDAQLPEPGPTWWPIGGATS